jgi:YD repeat-containing protein
MSFAYTLDANGKVTQTDVTDERGAVKRLQFNASGYPVTVTRALGQPEQQVLQNTVDQTTNLTTSTTDALGRTTSFQYDAFGNLTPLMLLDGTPSAVTWSYTYEPTYNQLASLTDPPNHTTTFACDTSGDLVQVTNALSNASAMTGIPPLSRTLP